MTTDGRAQDGWGGGRLPGTEDPQGWSLPDFGELPEDAPGLPAGPDQETSQIPILCRTCGAPSATSWDGLVTCPFCGQREQLPAESGFRKFELEHRLAAAAEGVPQLRGLDSALCFVFESRGAFLLAVGPWFFLAVAVSSFALVSSWETIASAPPGSRVGLIILSLMAPVVVTGIGLAVSISLFIGRMNYRRQVRHLLYAHAPRQPGRPIRCRACDATLAVSPDAFIACDHCGTQNLVTPEILRDRQRLLAAEIAFYSNRAKGLLVPSPRAPLYMSRIFILCAVAAYGGMVGLAYLARSLFS